MDDRKGWGLRGPVRTCRLERTWYSRRCGAETCDNETHRDSATLEFRADGALVRRKHRNWDRSEWVSTSHYDGDGRLTRVEGVGFQSYEYDTAGRLLRVIAGGPNGEERIAETYAYGAGRKEKTVFVDPSRRPPGAWGIEGTDSAYPSHGATQVTTVYDEHGRPVEVRFCTSARQVLGQVTLRYDASGNLVEELQSNSKEALPEELLASLNPKQLESVGILFGVTEPNRRVHRYDERGRRIETLSGIAPLQKTRIAREFNDLGDQIWEATEESESDFGLDDDGQLSEHPSNRRTSRSEARFLYEYDPRENWVSKTVETRWDGETAYTVSSIERRTIEYFD